MNKVIVTQYIGKQIGKNLNKLEEYLKLWEKFEKLLENKDIKLPTFAKNWDKLEWEKYSDSENPEQAFYETLKKMSQNKNKLKKVYQTSIDKLTKYIKFLDTDFIVQELHNDESYEHWFD